MTAISSWKRGDHAPVARVTITKDDDPVDLTNDYEIVWQLRMSPNAGSFVSVDIDMTDADSGVLYGSLEDSVTKKMTPGIWVSDLEITGPDGKPYSSNTFEVEVLPDVSRAVPPEAP
jgi:hypothetical protein